MRKSILIYGAGAIGRGYIPWVFSPADYRYSFVESDERLRSKLNQTRRFTTYKVKNGDYEPLTVPIEHCFSPGEELDILPGIDAVVTAVGPRNMLSLEKNLTDVKVPIICCENDSKLPAFMTAITSNPNFFFAIPDVITSNTAPESLLEKDPLSIVTEDGVCFIDDRAGQLKGDCRYVGQNELHKQWLAKLYIHNTPHCIAAYLGALVGRSYLHESMQQANMKDVVAGAMAEMERMVVRKFGLDPVFVKWYADKELQRFQNALLFDPIIRVAREPFRKLAPNDRLIGAAQLCLNSGIIPNNILLGIMAAFCYSNSKDPDFNIKYLMASLDPNDFLRIIIGLRPGEALFELLCEKWTDSLEALAKLKISHG